MAGDLAGAGSAHRDDHSVHQAYRQDSAERWEFLFFRVSLLICVMVTYYVLLQSLESLRRQVALEQQLMFDKELLEIQTLEQSKRSQLLIETAQQTRQMRHDLRHHLTAIRAMAGDENPNLTAYLSELIRDIPAAVRDYCENSTANAWCPTMPPAAGRRASPLPPG